ncbi:hypothetical protein NPS01_20880 [Nocardioides psychrotolerans]|nr:hypothetical protein NPS01_20880 [Nocardioides psychrotolerans]
MRRSAVGRPIGPGSGGQTMWDTHQDNKIHLSHDMPCHRCGHGIHTFLACGDQCSCEPSPIPGELAS